MIRDKRAACAGWERQVWSQNRRAVEAELQAGNRHVSDAAARGGGGWSASLGGLSRLGGLFTCCCGSAQDSGGGHGRNRGIVWISNPLCVDSFSGVCRRTSSHLCSSQFCLQHAGAAAHTATWRPAWVLPHATSMAHSSSIDTGGVSTEKRGRMLPTAPPSAPAAAGVGTSTGRPSPRVSPGASLLQARPSPFSPSSASLLRQHPQPVSMRTPTAVASRIPQPIMTSTVQQQTTTTFIPSRAPAATSRIPSLLTANAAQQQTPSFASGTRPSFATGKTHRAARPSLRRQTTGATTALLAAPDAPEAMLLVAGSNEDLSKLSASAATALAAELPPSRTRLSARRYAQGNSRRVLPPSLFTILECPSTSQDDYSMPLPPTHPTFHNAPTATTHQPSPDPAPHSHVHQPTNNPTASTSSLLAELLSPRDNIISNVSITHCRDLNLDEARTPSPPLIPSESLTFIHASPTRQPSASSTPDVHTDNPITLPDLALPTTTNLTPVSLLPDEDFFYVQDPTDITPDSPMTQTPTPHEDTTSHFPSTDDLFYVDEPITPNHPVPVPPTPEFEPANRLPSLDNLFYNQVDVNTTLAQATSPTRSPLHPSFTPTLFTANDLPADDDFFYTPHHVSLAVACITSPPPALVHRTPTNFASRFSFIDLLPEDDLFYGSNNITLNLEPDISTLPTVPPLSSSFLGSLSAKPQSPFFNTPRVAFEAFPIRPLKTTAVDRYKESTLDSYQSASFNGKRKLAPASDGNALARICMTPLQMCLPAEPLNCVQACDATSASTLERVVRREGMRSFTGVLPSRQAQEKRELLKRLRTAEKAARTTIARHAGQAKQLVNLQRNHRLKKACKRLYAVINALPVRSDGAPCLSSSTKASLVQSFLVNTSLPCVTLGSGFFGSVLSATCRNRPEWGVVAVKQMKLLTLKAVEDFGTEACMMAQFGEEGAQGAHLAMHGMSLTVGDAPGVILGHMYMEKGDCTFTDKLAEMMLEASWKAAEWAANSSISPEALCVMKAGHETQDAAAMMGIFADVSEDLVCLGGLGICHNDVKFANVVFARGRAHLIDYGLSVRRLHGETFAPSKGGTNILMAPECTWDLEPGPTQASRCSTTSDGFALAMMLASALEFGTNEAFCITRALAAHCHGLPAFLHRMLHAEAEQRPSPDEVAIAFRAFHTTLLGKCQDLVSSTSFLLKWVVEQGSVSCICAGQLRSLKVFSDSRDSLRTALLLDVTGPDFPLLVDLRKEWFVWDEVGCAGQLEGYLVMCATTSLDMDVAKARVCPTIKWLAWHSGVMEGFRQQLVEWGCTCGLKEAWDSNSYWQTAYNAKAAVMTL